MSRADNTNKKYLAPFATAIRALMISNGTRQNDLADKIGKTHQTVSQYVNGISEPGYDILVKIADHFDVSTDFLLGRTQNRSRYLAATDDLGFAAEGSLSTINRALGMIEGVSCGVNNPVADTLIDAVEMIDNAVKELTNGK